MFHVTQQGAVKVICGESPLSGESVLLAADVCNEALAHGQPKIVIDLSAVPLIDSAGLELLLDVRDRCAERGGAVVLAAPSPLCCDILAATGVINDIAVFDDAVSAVGSFAQ